MSLVVYGIPNCGSVKKARAWLDAKTISYTFHDYKKLGIDAATLERWIDVVGWERLLNRAGTTFKKLPASDKVEVDRVKAVALMTRCPSMIRRPVVEGAKPLLVGFKPDDWASVFAG